MEILPRLIRLEVDIADRQRFVILKVPVGATSLRHKSQRLNNGKTNFARLSKALGLSPVLPHSEW